MLSYTRGEPIAVIRGGRDDGKIIYYYDPNKKCCAKCNDKCLQARKKCCKDCKIKEGGCATCGGEIPDIRLDNPLEVLDKKFWGRKHIHPIKMEALKQALIKNIDPIGTGLDEGLVKRARDHVRDREKNEIKIVDEGVIVPHPRCDSREICYISAPSGAGKSTYSANYMKEYSRMFPKSPIYIFSRLEKDKALDDIPGTERIMINDELLEDPIDPATELVNCLVLFDDIDTIRDKELRDEVQRLRDDIMEIGRHPSTYCIATTHMMMNYKQTRGLINEAHTVTMFPQYTPYYHMKRYLEVYAGLAKNQIRDLLKLPSRWVTISQKGPRYLMYEKGVMLLSHLHDQADEQK